ncbi:MAG: histidinol dehydrogenase, partial [Saprospiraceae bacterium]|nr:histidinol dehydrogenase [Saprospiraceae bacterium]
MKISIEPKRIVWEDLCIRPSGHDESQDSMVQNILDQVKKKGDEALKQFTLKFDRVELQTFSVSKEELVQAEAKMDPNLI